MQKMPPKSVLYRLRLAVLRTLLRQDLRKGVGLMTERAIKKLDTEFKECKSLSQKGKAVSSAVLDALKTFCRQNTEFSQAVVQSNKPIQDCIESTVKGCGGSISDIEVYRKAVQFYFPGSNIRFSMTIDLGDNGFSNAPDTADTVHETSKAPAKKGLSLSLDELLK